MQIELQVREDSGWKEPFLFGGCSRVSDNPLMYRKVNGEVEILGAVYLDSGYCKWGKDICNIPYRPHADISFYCRTPVDDNVIMCLNVDKNGTLYYLTPTIQEARTIYIYLKYSI